MELKNRGAEQLSSQNAAPRQTSAKAASTAGERSSNEKPYSKCPCAPFLGSKPGRALRPEYLHRRPQAVAEALKAAKVHSIEGDARAD